MRRNLCVMALAMLLLPDSLQPVVADHPLEQPIASHTTGNPFDVYDTQSSEEFFDPMKQPLRAYQDFLRTNDREYLTAESLVTLAPTNVYADETPETTLVVANEEPTTVQPEQRTTTVEVVENDDEEEQNMASQALPYVAELTSKKQGKMFVPHLDSDNTLQVADHLHAVSNNETDIDEDEETQTNESLPSVAITTTTTVTPTVVERSRKIAAKKIVETTTHIYKYSANKILRKYLEDQYIRSPMAAVVYTGSDALRKAQLLWKSALRPNSAIDIVLLAYNAAGIYFFFFRLYKYCIEKGVV